MTNHITVSEDVIKAMIFLKVLGNLVRQPQQQYPPPQQQQYDEDMGYRTMTREDVAMIQERRISSALMSPQQTSPMNNVPAAPALPSNNVQPSPVSPPSNPGNLIVSI